MKNGKSNFGFSFHKNIGNFEVFWGVKNFSKNLLFLRSGPPFEVFYAKIEMITLVMGLSGDEVLFFFDTDLVVYYQRGQQNSVAK